jgi:uncharacterized membrane protein
MVRHPTLTVAAIAALTLLASALPKSAAALAQEARGDVASSGVDAALHGIATVIEIAGVGIIVGAALLASARYLRQGFGGLGWSEAYRCYRANLGRGILLGLELLVAADIIGTVAVTPSFESLGVLALIVLIRTFLSFSLEIEIEGRWPWRRNEAQPSSLGGATSPPS